MRSSTPLLLVAALAGGCATQQVAGDLADAAARAATQQWINAFNTCTQPSTIALLYEPSALLWGTASPTLTSTPGAVLTYFDRPCTSSPKPTVELGQFQVRSHGEFVTSAGVYTFTTFPGGQPRVSPARFSFTFRRNGDQWLIVNHHSSLMPAPPVAPAPAPQPRQ